MAESLAGRLAPRKPPRGDGWGLRALMVLGFRVWGFEGLKRLGFRDLQIEGQGFCSGCGAQTT